MPIDCVLEELVRSFAELLVQVLVFTAQNEKFRAPVLVGEKLP
jgi:hypothetical protein